DQHPGDRAGLCPGAGRHRLCDLHLRAAGDERHAGREQVRRRPEGAERRGVQLRTSRMGFVEAIATCLRKYVTFSGRARRSEYWYFLLFQGIAALAAAAVNSWPVWLITGLILFMPGVAVTVRRLHDVNRSGAAVL